MGIEWNEKSMATGVEVIDSQHKKLIEIIQSLDVAIQDHPLERNILKDCLGCIFDYAYYHFQTEEYYFDAFGFPGKVAHRKEHQYFIERYRDFEKRFNKGSDCLEIAKEIHDFLVSWLSHHISGSDQSFVPLFKKSGL